MSRTIEFIRPSSRVGVIACRNVSWFTFAKKPTIDPAKPVRTMTTAACARGAAGTPRPSSGGARDSRVRDHPADAEALDEPLVHERADEEPELASARTTPISVALQCRTRTKYTISIA